MSVASRLVSIGVAATLLCGGLNSRAQAQEEGSTPGAIPNPGSYQGSMELQRREHEQEQQFQYQQQQSQQRQQEYYQGGPARGYAPGYAPPAARMAPGADLQAFRRGDYATAYRLTIGNAQRGQAVAQHNIGLLYENGWGVPRNYAQAAYWYRRAAVQGYPNAANDLARMYGLGLGVARDTVQSYVWFTRAAPYATNSTDRAAILNNRAVVSARMTPAELAQARRLAGGGTRTIPAAHRRRY